MVSVQQTNLLPENASQNNAIYPKSLYNRYIIYITYIKPLHNA